MNVVLLTAVIFAVALDQGAQGQQVPCQQTSGNNAYNTFVHRHILNDSNLDRNSKASWERYLVRRGICGRARVQSFIDAPAGQVQQICHNSGWRLMNGGSLCISDSFMAVYDIGAHQVNGQCRVRRLSPRQRRVLVACNNVGNKCLPVHYQAYGNPQPANVRCS